MTETAVVGVIINPVAGIGGRVALHGSDGSSAQTARDLGGISPAPARMMMALQALLEDLPQVRVLTPAGEMGAIVCRQAGLQVEEVSAPTQYTTPHDTLIAASTMRDRAVDLILFAGGDGTARDILAAVGTAIPLVGVPGGVKMHSAVFAVNPRAAGSAAAAYLKDPAGTGTTTAEVADLSAAHDPSCRDTRAGLTVFGLALVPQQRTRMQSMKSGSGRDDAADLAALGREVVAEMEPDRLYLLGPGSTVGHVKTAMGIDDGVLGVDVTLGSQLLQQDATEEQLNELLRQYPRASLILGVIGGQGFLLGRGNQQLSGRVLAAIRAENVAILASEGKLTLLDPPVLRVDLDDEAPDGLIGYRPVRTRPRHCTMMKIVN